MHTIKRYILLLLTTVMTICVATAQEPTSIEEQSVPSPTTWSTSDFDMEVSLITCTPGPDLYTNFGHTALRVKKMYTNFDWVFNYGCFDGSSNDFMFKFMLGETDYKLEAEPYEYFVERYRYMGCGVTEQVLNLTNEEMLRLIDLLDENIRPENQTYRYNWLEDNCTERARDVIEEAIKSFGGDVKYSRPVEANITVRDILHRCLTTSPWTDFGISLLLGSEIDHPVDRRIQMFIPYNYMSEADMASIVRNGEAEQPLVKENRRILTQTFVDESNRLFSPSIVFGALLIFTILLSVYDMRRQRQSVWFDVIITTAQGIAGCIIAFLFFLSEHPSVDSNWLVVIFNPIALFYAGWMVYCSICKKKNMLAIANVITLTAFIPTMFICKQTFCVATYIVVFILLVRALVQNTINRATQY